MSSEKSTIDNLLEKGWALADAQQHPLGSLQGRGLDSYKLLVLIGAKTELVPVTFRCFFKIPLGSLAGSQ